MGAVWRGDGFGQILCLFSSLNWKRKLYNLHFLFSSLNLSHKAYFCKVIVHTHLDKMIAEYTKPNNVCCYLQNKGSKGPTNGGNKEQIHTRHTYNAWSQVLKKRNLQNLLSKKDGCSGRWTDVENTSSRMLFGHPRVT